MIDKHKDFEARITAMLAILEGKQTLTQPERHDLKQRLESLKFDLRMEAKCSSPISSTCNEAACELRFAQTPIQSTQIGQVV